MAPSIPALVQPAVLRWARESVGLIPVAAARKIGVPDHRLQQWESGDVQPTIAQLMGTGGNRHAADPFVIGLAHARGRVVGTEETLSGRLDKPRIPDVRSALGLPWTNLVGFIGQQDWQF